MRNILIFMLLILTTSCLFAGSNIETHLFQSFFRDAIVTSDYYAEAEFDYSTYEYASIIDFGVKGGYGLMENLELGGGLSFVSISPDYGDGESGISDLLINGKYLFSSISLPLTAGGYLTLPIGSEDIGEGNLNFGFFGATRYPVQENLVLTGNLGLDFYEAWVIKNYKLEEEYESCLNIGLGALYTVSQEMIIIPELAFRSEGNYSLFSVGAEYDRDDLPGKIRGFIGLGLDNGAPDFEIGLGMLF